ncbi:keratin-associated protein 21-1-like [Equus quagga]|nr:keratin-associated protein 21-1-like [Equus quagga]
MNGTLCQLLTVYKGPGEVEDTHTSETSSCNPPEFSSPDNMCCNYYGNSCGYGCRYGYGCGFGPYYGCGSDCGYGCGYGPHYGCGYGTRYGHGYGSCYGCGYGSGSGYCGHRPFFYRRYYSSCC